MNIKNELYGLAYECPFIERKDDCPFKVSDSFSFKEKVRWINGLSDAEKERMVKHHKECYKNREFERAY